MKKAIPDSIRQQVLEEAGYQCVYCGHRDGLNLTIHHILRTRDGGKTSFYNLMALCYNCHHRVDESNTIADKELRRLKRYLIHKRLTQAGVNALKIAYNNSFGVVAAPFAITHLVEEKLLKYIKWQMFEVDRETGGETEAMALYRITDKGRKIVEDWIIP